MDVCGSLLVARLIMVAPSLLKLQVSVETSCIQDVQKWRPASLQKLTACNVATRCVQNVLVPKSQDVSIETLWYSGGSALDISSPRIEQHLLIFHPILPQPFSPILEKIPATNLPTFSSREILRNRENPWKTHGKPMGFSQFSPRPWGPCPSDPLRLLCHHAVSSGFFLV